jgi:hypothetical protein
LGRKPKNKFEGAYLVFKDNAEIKKYDVKMPFCYAITVETNDPNIAKTHTTWEYFLKDDSKLDELIKEIESQPFKVKVIKVEPAVRPILDLCPRCHKRGVPKIEKKNTSDNRERSGRYQEKTSSLKKREPEFWLTYVHTRTKKCRISQYVNTPHPAYKHNKIDIEKYFFPHILGHMKKGSVWYSD